MLKFAQFATSEYTYDSMDLDGAIQVFIDGKVKKAYPCLPLGSWEIPSRKFIELFRNYLGVWVTESENGELVYVGFAWKNVDTSNPNSTPFRWMQITESSTPSFNTKYPYLKFKISEGWLFLKGDGGDFGHLFSKNPFLLLKNTVYGTEISINRDGFYFYDRYYLEDEQRKEEVRNRFLFNKGGIILEDRFKNALTFGQLVKSGDENKPEEQRQYVPYLELRNANRSVLKFYEKGIELADQPLTSSNNSKNYLSFSSVGINIIDKFKNSVLLTNDGIEIKYKDSNKLIKITENSIIIQFGNNVLEISSEGLKYNGKYLISENFTDWMNQCSSSFGLGNFGAPVPFYPSTITSFINGNNSVSSSQSFKTVKK